VKLLAVIHDAEQKLATAGIDNPALDVTILIGHALGLDRAQLLGQSERALAIDEFYNIEQLIIRRAAHEPVARIVGEREFWSLPFGLNEATLEPRPDSETLVEAALQSLRGKLAPRILDLGTGTGCLLLALLHELSSATGVGIDIAPRAIEQAQTNAKRLRLGRRARFQVGNWLDYIEEKFDAIISNPPYIATNDIASLMPEVREHDPRRALDGGKDGLEIYRLLIPQLRHFLKPEGIAIFEIGQGQAQAVETLFRDAGLMGIIQFRDLSGIERCLMTHMP